MPVTSADLWKLLTQSRLLSATRLDEIRIAFAQAGYLPDQVPARMFAQWLIQRDMLTQYQAKLLLNGRSGPFRYGDYQIQDRIRSGRLRKTFQAVHLPSQFGVHLKFAGSRVAVDPRQWNTARQYIHAVSRIAHGQLQSVFAIEDQAGYRFLVLEQLTGASLAAHVQEYQRLTVSEACRIVRLVALGLAALHEQRQVHGDVRPENLWLVPPDNVKLLRDNLHPPVVPALWQPGLTTSQMAQADYMAPQLAHPGTPLSQATDIYALGCTLYELLEGSPPLPGGQPTDKLRRHATDPIKPIRAQQVPEELAKVVEALLAKDPTSRPVALDVAECLVPFLEPSDTAVPEVRPAPEFFAFQEMIRRRTGSVRPAPPPLIPEPNERLPLAEPPVQTDGMARTLPLPRHMTQEIERDADLRDDADQVPYGQALAGASAVRHSRPLHRRRRRQQTKRKQAITLGAFAIALLIVTACVFVLQSRTRESRTRNRGVAVVDQPIESRATGPIKAVAPKTHSSTDSDPTATQYEVRGNDSNLLWMTPTTGSPIELQYVAPGAQILLIVRPHELESSTHGKMVLQALGPDFESGRRAWEHVVGYRFGQIDHLVVCLHASDVTPLVSFVVRLLEPQSSEALVAAWGNPAVKQHDGHRYYLANDWGFYVPEQESVTQFVVGSEQVIQEVIDLRDTAPILRRELAVLLQNSDRDRHVSLAFVPDFVTQCLLLDGTWVVHPQRLREAITWLMSDQTKGCLISMQFDDPFFVELRAYGQASIDSLALANSLRERIGAVPDKIESLFEQIYPSIYWRRVALRFPEMVRFLYRYTRVGVEDDQAIVNAALPGQAAHNLVFGAEMLVNTRMDAETEKGTEVRASVTTSAPQTIDELLDQPMDLSFGQKSLEFAIEDLAGAVRETFPMLPFPFDIQILGSDLQLNGITRNQQISDFTARNRTVAEILTDIVMRANPVTTVSEPSEVDQKLIWVIGSDPTDPKKHILLITTRDAAQRKGYSLPAPFQSK